MQASSAVDDLGSGRRCEEQVHRAELVGFDVGEADPPQRFEGDRSVPTASDTNGNS